MAEIGYTMTCEQRSPKDLVADLVEAERAGFDFSVISDHHPRLEERGHAGYAWSILGGGHRAHPAHDLRDLSDRTAGPWATP